MSAWEFLHLCVPIWEISRKSMYVKCTDSNPNPSGNPWLCCLNMFRIFTRARTSPATPGPSLHHHTLINTGPSSLGPLILLVSPTVSTQHPEHSLSHILSPLLSTFQWLPFHSEQLLKSFQWLAWSSRTCTPHFISCTLPVSAPATLPFLPLLDQDMTEDLDLNSSLYLEPSSLHIHKLTLLPPSNLSFKVSSSMGPSLTTELWQTAPTPLNLLSFSH